MSLEATANFIGKEGFNWWVGQIENDGGGFYNFVNGGFDFEDWDWTNKVKVRIVGFHNPSRSELPTEDLPWATVLMPCTSAQRSGIGTQHQLQINSWVVGFFMDGTSSQIPIVMGSIGDENPAGGYGTEFGKQEGFAQLGATDWKEKTHGESGTMPAGSGPNVETDPKTGLDVASTKKDGKQHNSTESNNPRSASKQDSKSQEIGDKDQKVSVQIANGKCGSETATKIEEPLKDFMKMARKLEKNSAGKFLDKESGRIVDLQKEIAGTAGRIQTKLNGLVGNIKGKVMDETNKMVQEKLDEINIPNPDLDLEVKGILKETSGIVSCLFKDILDQMKDFIKGMLNDLLENALDSALCLVKDFINEIMNKVMNLIRNAMSMIDGISGKIKDAADMIEGLISKTADIADLFCAPDIGCALDASIFETGFGPKAKGNDAKQKNVDQYKFKPPTFGQVVGSGIPMAGKVPFVNNLGVKQVFDTVTGTTVALDSVAGLASGITGASFDTKSPLQKFEGLNFYGADGKPNTATLNCSPSIKNKKPCFPEMVWDNLQSTSPVKALPIIDDIGTILGIYMKKKGSDILNLEATARAQFTCNEPEGGGAQFKPVIVDGKVDSVQVLNGGIGYGFDPSSTYCPNEQMVVLVNKASLIMHVKDGEALRLVAYADGTPGEKEEVMQVVDVDYSEDLIEISTIDMSWAHNVDVGVKLVTKSNHEFTLNYNKKYPDLVFPPSATAIWAGCPDLIPLLDQIEVVNVGSGYVNPVITIGSGVDKQEIGTYTKDSEGKLLEPKLNKKVLGFVKPVIEDKGYPNVPGAGSGAQISPIYSYSGPQQIKETNILELQTYVDCVGKPTFN